MWMPALWLAFDSRSVTGLRLGGWSTGVQACSQAALPAGALVPSPTGTVLLDPEAVRQAAAHVLQALGARRARVRLLLPDGLARVVRLEVPRQVGANEFARFRLGPSLPFGAHDAAFGTLKLPRSNAVLAAGLSRGTVAGFEGLVRSLGCEPAGVSLASLAALEPLTGGALLREGVALLLGDTSVLYVGMRAGRLALVRQRHLPDVETGAERLAAEAQRTASLVGLAPHAPLALAGRGAALVRQHLEQSGRAARLLDLGLRGAPQGAADWCWLRGLAA